MRGSRFLIKEEIPGDRPLWWVFYANETKAQFFSTRAEARAFLKELKEEESLKWVK